MARTSEMISVPGPLTWRQAFLFAHEEAMRAFDLMAMGDTVGALMLIETAKQANALATRLHAEQA